MTRNTANVRRISVRRAQRIASAERRRRRLEDRMAAATTADERLAVALDYLRSAWSTCPAWLKERHVAAVVSDLIAHGDRLHTDNTRKRGDTR